MITGDSYIGSNRQHRLSDQVLANTGECRAPGVQHGRDTNPRAQTLGIVGLQPTGAAVRQRSIALITFNWSRLICPLLASRQAGP